MTHIFNIFTCGYESEVIHNEKRTGTRKFSYGCYIIFTRVFKIFFFNMADFRHAKVFHL